MDAGFETTLALKLKWRPDGEALAVCREHGREIARQWALHPLEPIKLSSTPASAVDEPCAPKPAVNSGLPFAEPVAATCAADKRVMQCSVCQWLYDPAIGEPMQDVAPGTPWSQVPDTFLCPECGLGKDVFDELK
jgi:anaerobic nitric oxide reductase flavorubredoxin